MSRTDFIGDYTPHRRTPRLPNRESPGIFAGYSSSLACGWQTVTTGQPVPATALWIANGRPIGWVAGAGFAGQGHFGCGSDFRVAWVLFG